MTSSRAAVRRATCSVPSNAARLAARSWRRLHDYLIPHRALADVRCARSAGAVCVVPRVRASLRRARRDRRSARWLTGRTTSDSMPRNASRCAGFDAMPPAMTRLLERWRAQGSRRRDRSAVAATLHDVTVVAADDATAELELAAQWARDAGRWRARATSASSSADLAARRDEVRRVFEDVFAPASATDAERHVADSRRASQRRRRCRTIRSSMRRCSCCSSRRASARAPMQGDCCARRSSSAGEAERSQRALADRRLRDEQRDRWDWFELERWAALTGCEQLQLAARDVNARRCAALAQRARERLGRALSRAAGSGRLARRAHAEQRRASDAREVSRRARRVRRARCGHRPHEPAAGARSPARPAARHAVRAGDGQRRGHRDRQRHQRRHAVRCAVGDGPRCRSHARRRSIRIR